MTEEITPQHDLACCQHRTVVTSELALNLYETQTQMEFECIILQTWWWLKVEALIYFNTPKNETFTAFCENSQMYVFYYASNPREDLHVSGKFKFHTVGLINHHSECKWRWPQPQRSHNKWMAAFLLHQKLNDGWIGCSLTQLLFQISSGLFEYYKNESLKRPKSLKRVN